MQLHSGSERIGAGERERQRSIHVYRLNLSMKRQVVGDGDGDDVASRGRTAQAHVVVHASPSRNLAQPAHMLPQEFTFTFGLVFLIVGQEPYTL